MGIRFNRAASGLCRSDAGSRRVVDEGFPADKRVHRAVLDHALNPFLEAQASSVQTLHGGVAGRVHQHRTAPVVADCAAVRFRRQMGAVEILRQREGLTEPAPPALQFVLVVEFAHFFFPLMIRSAVAGVIITPPPPFAAGTFTSTTRSCPHAEHVTRPFAAMMSDTFTLSVSARHLWQRSWPVCSSLIVLAFASPSGSRTSFRRDGFAYSLCSIRHLRFSARLSRRTTRRAGHPNNRMKPKRDRLAVGCRWGCCCSWLFAAWLMRVVRHQLSPYGC